MNKPQIRVLIVEDDLIDRLAARRAMTRDDETEFVLIEAETGREGLAKALSERPDCILLDYQLPDLNGLEFLTEFAGLAEQIAVPVMLLTGGDSATVAAAAIKLGAADYLGKDIDRQYLDLLPGAIRRVLRERTLTEDKRRAEAKFRSLVEQIDAITYIVEPGENGTVQYISPQIAVLGYTPQEWLSDQALQTGRIHADDRVAASAAFAANRILGTALNHEFRMLSRDGEVMWFRARSKPVADETGHTLFIQGILVDITQNKLAEQALRQSQIELRQLAGHLENIKEAERKRIAQEIHDELGGILTGIKAYVSVYMERSTRAGNPPDPLLQDAANLADTGFQAVRRVITDLRPSVLDQLGVWAALEWYAGQIEKRSGLPCCCTIAAAAAAFDIGTELSTMLFRIVQEALTNAVRHAGASQINISAQVEGDALIVDVQDNGIGIDLTQQSKRESWGIVGMYERARYFGGELTMTGKPASMQNGRPLAGGTNVRLRLPLEIIHAEQ
jgi:two-component system sensor histidine kinase UhpB